MEKDRESALEQRRLELWKSTCFREAECGYIYDKEEADFIYDLERANEFIQTIRDEDRRKDEITNCIDNMPINENTNNKSIGWDLEYSWGGYENIFYDSTTSTSNTRLHNHHQATCSQNSCNSTRSNNNNNYFSNNIILKANDSSEYGCRRSISKRKRMTDEQINQLTKVADLSYNKEIKLREAIECMSELNVNEKTARCNIIGYRRMLEGKSIDATINSKVLDKFLTNIKEIYGSRACSRAIGAVESFIEKKPNSKIKFVLLSHWLNN